MNFRVFAAGLVLILLYQLAIAAVAIWFVVHCEAGASPSREDRAAIALTGNGSS